MFKVVAELYCVSGSAQSDGRMSLAVRFPEKLWNAAKQYFCSNKDDTDTAMEPTPP